MGETGLIETLHRRHNSVARARQMAQKPVENRFRDNHLTLGDQPQQKGKTQRILRRCNRHDRHCPQPARQIGQDDGLTHRRNTRGHQQRDAMFTSQIEEMQQGALRSHPID